VVETLRKSGIDIIGDVPWGTHFCQFYQTGQDLLDILVPYFKTGLENNEFCMWVTAQPVTETAAEQALRAALPDIDRYVQSGQLEIMSHVDWYLKDGVFESERVLIGWVDKLNAALKKGFDGLRLTGNTFWLEKSDWDDFTAYEASVDSVIGQYRMMALCTYASDKCGAAEVADVVSNHQFALVKRPRGWEAIEGSERKRIQARLIASQTKHRRLFENMPDACAYHQVLYDENRTPVDYVFLEVNEAFERQTGLRRLDIIGRRVTEVLPGIETSSFDWIGTYGRIALAGDRIRFEQFSDALSRWYSVSAYSPEADHFVAIFTDITEKKRAEDEIKRANESLQQRAAELDAINQELEAFTYSVSHDLQAPLRSIDGFSGILLEEYGDRLDSEGKTHLGRVRAASLRMAQLIDDLLDLSRITRHAINCEHVDLSALARNIAMDLQEAEPQRQVEFVIQPGLAAAGDRRLLQLVIENLLRNAWKFTGKHSEACIEFGMAESNGVPAYFVRDDGAGFDMAHYGKLFGAFQRLHNINEFPGNGIGLATVQRIVRRHGGRVWAQGCLEQGATFYFTLRPDNSAF